MDKMYKINGNPEEFADLGVFHKLSQQFLPFAQKRMQFDKPVGINLISDPENAKNPLGNVLLPEIKYNPKRPAAAPSFNPEVEKEINTSAGNVGPDPRLFLDLGDTLSFEQPMQRFYTTANSRVANDQTAFAKFCYGDMPSCKEGNGLQCLKDNPRWINY